MAEDMGDKTELPTERKRSKARDDGNIAKSTDITAVADLLVVLLLVWFFGATFVQVSIGLLKTSLTIAGPADAFSLSSLQQLFIASFLSVLPVTASTMFILVIIALVANISQTGGLLVASKPLQPDINRLNPISGFQRIFGRKNLVKGGISLLKLCAVLSVAVMATVIYAREFAALPNLSVVGATVTMAMLVLKVAAWILAVLILLAVLDLAFTRWQHTQELKMTKQEVKDERKETDGDPEIKSRIARMGREIALGKLKREVPQADVIVTNPTHYAVALKYDNDTMAAPRVVAKGVDFMAFRIRDLAIAAKVPIVEKPELARALYATTKVGQTIDSRFFQAVAEVLAYVYRIQGRAA
jgi:flagellar biosynthesis protein FlhB